MALTRINNNSLSAVTAAGLPADTIVNVVQTTKTDVASSTDTGWVPVSGMSATITPKTTSSKILIIVQANVSSGSSINAGGALRIYKGTSALPYYGDALGSRIQGAAQMSTGNDWQIDTRTIIYVDSPATTDSTTYNLYWRTKSGTQYLNRANSTTDNDDRCTMASSITLMEIAG